jgi:23S rRNA (uracil1939-C5)-methyltransferase
VSVPAESGSGREITLDVERLVAGGQGLGRMSGKAVFVPGVLPGEKVRARIVEERRDFDRALLLEVLRPSPGRRQPPCSLAGVCGGCDWLHIDYDRQLENKLVVVREALRRVGGIDAPDMGIEAGQPLAYRNRAQIHRDPAGRLGFMGARSNRVVPVASCPVVVPEINRVFSGEVPAAGRRRFGVFGSEGRVIQEGSGGQDVRVVVAGRTIRFSVGCFFQSNLAMLDRLVVHVMEGLAGSTAADLYCGIGVFGAHLAARFRRVIAVESDAAAAAWARSNIGEEGNEFHATTVEEWISAAAPSGIDAAVADPPRAGLSDRVRKWLLRRPVGTLVYVSCNPVTLARDLASLLSGGYRLQGIRLFDFFPQTSHVESVARLAAEG